MKLDDFEQLKERADDGVQLTVWADTSASGWRDITLTKEQLDTCRDENGDLVQSLVEEKATEAAFQAGMPDTCAHCSGWNQSSGIELSDWEPREDDVDAVRLKS